MSSFSFFDYWKIIIGATKLTQQHIDAIDSDYSKWMINKLISNDVRMLECCHTLKRFTNIPNLAHFKAIQQYYKEKIGKTKIYIHYSKVAKQDEDTKIISDYYNVSYYDAVNYKEMISDDEMNTLRENYNDTNKLTNQNVKMKRGK